MTDGYKQLGLLILKMGTSFSLLEKFPDIDKAHAADGQPAQTGEGLVKCRASLGGFANFLILNWSIDRNIRWIELLKTQAAKIGDYKR